MPTVNTADICSMSRVRRKTNKGGTAEAQLLSLQSGDKSFFIFRTDLRSTLMENTEKKQVVLSLIQPTGTPTLGNYLGAFKNWKKMAQDYNCLFGAADLHSITVRTEPADLRKRTADLFGRVQ